MKIIKKVTMLGAMLGAGFAFGSGFALYQPSTKANALGGATLGEAVDASANTINPATLVDITNVTLTAGFVTEHPRCRIRTNGQSSRKMDPGFFMLPHVQLAVPLPKGFAFGLGFSADYGLGTRYSRGWEMDWNSRKTTVKGLVLNPNLAYSITPNWSIGAGLRFVYFDFEQESNPMAVKDGVYYGKLGNRLKGDNNMHEFGWQVGTRYRVNDAFSIGALYRSKIDVDVEGHSSTTVTGYDFTAAAKAAQAYAPYGDAAVKAAYAKAQQMIVDNVNAGAAAANGVAEAHLELPQSVSFGFNWDITPTVHLGAAVTWTEWSSLETLRFRLPAGDKRVSLRWEDTWRFSIAPSWDFAENWTAMFSYIYDQDSTGSQESVMLPPADRHILTAGLAWQCTPQLEFALSYGVVLMDGGSMRSKDALGREYTLSSHRGLSHAAGFSVTYRF